MQTLRQTLERADTRKVAVGHFNVSDLVTLKAVFESARDLKLPVIVGVSEGERQFIGVHSNFGDGQELSGTIRLAHFLER